MTRQGDDGINAEKQDAHEPARRGASSGKPEGLPSPASDVAANDKFATPVASDKQTPGRSGTNLARAARNPKAAVAGAFANTKLGKAASLTKPTAEGAKATTKEVAKGAAKGAATGGWIGAAKGAAVSFAKTKAGRRVIAGIGVLALLVTIAIPAGFIIGVTMMTSAFSSSDEQRSLVAVEASGIEEPVARTAANVARTHEMPWPIVLAVQEEDAEGFDAERLSESLDGLNTIGVGAKYVNSVGLAPGESETDIANAEAEKDGYLAALQMYGYDEKTSTLLYEQALEWYFGQMDVCTAEAGPATPEEPVEGAPADTAETPVEAGAAEITTADGRTESFSDAQVNNIIELIGTAKTIDGVTDDAIIIALMTVLVESRGKNYANSTLPVSLGVPHDAVGSDHDSVGMFQQRPHWGTGATRDERVLWLMDIPNSVQAFFGGPNGPNGGSPRGLFDIPGWETKPKGEVAQAVQVSAFPDRYADEEAMAVALYERYGGAAIVGCNTGVGSGAGGHPVGDPNWPISSGYGPRDVCDFCSDFHQGIDFGGLPDFCHMPIYAIDDGTIIKSGQRAGGYGNIVTINHGTYSSLYAHQADGSEKYWPPVGTTVKAGDLIGRIGTTGNSQACHLHLEITVDTAKVDAAAFLTNELGVSLVWLANSTGKLPGAVVVPWYTPDLSQKLS